MTDTPRHQRVLIVDFGSQVTQLIARRVRESGVYCEIHPFDKVDAAFLRGFSPGAIDGRMGTNLQHAIEAFAQAHGQTSDGSVDPALWTSLVGADAGPVVQAYRITADDEAGPFIGTPPKDYTALSKLPALGYTTPLQELSEKFHMDQKLLQTLNPGADFGKVGQALLVAAPVLWFALVIKDYFGLGRF